MIHSSDDGDLRQSLRDVLTAAAPLGPSATEELVDHADAFLELYERKSRTDSSSTTRPSYVLGRKGAGKTAYLIGESWSLGHEVVSVKAHNTFSVMDDVRVKWEGTRGTMLIDHMASIWEALLVHAAIRGLVELSDETWDPGALDALNRYLNGLLKDLDAAKEERFIFALGQRFTEEIARTDEILPVRDVLARMRGSGMTFADAREQLAAVLDADEAVPLDVVIDNLEDLHMHVDRLEPVLAGLFRIVAKLDDATDPLAIPFDLRFAFPAEMLRKLRSISANPEKDFKRHITLNWKASELIDLAGDRLATSLGVHFEVRNKRIEGLDTPLDGDPEDVLRAVLPKGEFLDGLGVVEDPLGYVLRHTQLLPRHLIQILNAIIGPILSSSSFRRVTRDEVLAGVRASEDVIVEGILSSYLHDYPNVGESLEKLQNQLGFVFTERELQHAYNRAGVKRLTGERSEDFERAALAVGAIGIVRRTGTDRYVVGDFSYIEGAQQLQPVPERDRLCLHPLFVHRLFDHRGLDFLRSKREKPVYPYGILPEELT